MEPKLPEGECPIKRHFEFVTQPFKVVQAKDFIIPTRSLQNAVVH